MKGLLKKIIVLTTSAAAVCGVFTVTACDDTEAHTHTYAESWSNDATNHWYAATCEHTSEKKDSAAHTFDGDECSICHYKKETGPQISKPVENAKTYIFEAECTDMGHKTGLGYSGDATGRNMIQGGNSNASNGGWVGYLYAKGVAVNFIIESDKEVSNATLTLRIACEYINMAFNSDNYKIRLDYGVTQDDLDEYEGYWGEYFEDNKTGDGEIQYSEISITKSPISGVEFKDYTITTNLTLKKGLNMISLITNNEVLKGGSLGTMAAIAPMVDCIKITTDATLTMKATVDNGFGSDGCRIEND